MVLRDGPNNPDGVLSLKWWAGVPALLSCCYHAELRGCGSALLLPVHLIPVQSLSWEPPVASWGSSPGMGWMSFRYEVKEQDLYSSFPFPTQLSAQMSDVGVWWAGLTGMSHRTGAGCCQLPGNK